MVSGGVSVRRACRALEATRATYHDKSRRRDQAGLAAHQSDACALWLLPRACAAGAGRLGDQHEADLSPATRTGQKLSFSCPMMGSKPVGCILMKENDKILKKGGLSMFKRCKKLSFCMVVVAAASFLTFALKPASADTYPSHPVTIVVPFAAGGSADVYARVLAQQLALMTGASFIVDDQPGAGSIIGSEYVAKSTPDGYTLLLISNTHTVNETLFPDKPYKLMKDFVPVAPINSSDLVLVTRPTLGVKTVADLIKMAKAKPGDLSFASSGPGTPYYMAGKLFNQMAGVSILNVPYKSSSEARIDVIGGQVDMMFDAPTTMADFIRTGKVTALATTGKSRSDVLPNLPTISDAGVPGYTAVIWLGLVAPKGTPPAIVQQLNADISKIVQMPDIRASWLKQGAVPMVMTSPQFTDFLNADIKKWAKVIKISGATINQ